MERILSVNNVSKSFAGITALHELTTVIERGETRGLIGPNGSGKTTLINVISGFHTASSGSITFMGKEIPWDTPPDIRSRMGIVRTFQLTTIFPDATVEENVRWAGYTQTSSTVADSVFQTRRYRWEQEIQRTKAMELLDLVGLADRSDVVASTLSHGQQRRLEIAMALAVEPTLLLLDEPAAGLHPQARANLVELIRDLKRRAITIVVIEHNMKVIAATCDRVTCLNFGQVLAEGAPDEVISNHDVVKAYLGGKGYARS